MAMINVGYRKLFLIHECEIEIDTEQGRLYEAPLGDGLTTHVSFGQHPRLLTGVPIGTESTHMVRNDEGRIQGLVIAPPPPIGPDFVYLDVLVFRQQELDDDLFARWQAGDPGVHRMLRTLVPLDEKKTRTAADVVAAIVGLRFHRQLVMDPVVESLYVEGPDQCTTWPEASFGELLRPLTLSYDRFRQELLTYITPTEFPRVSKYAPTLSWLLEAWGERDSQTRFLMLYIALELLLEHYTTDQSPPMPEEAKIIKRLINKHAADDQRNMLLSYYDKMYNQSTRVPQNSLSGCFRRLAALANFPTKAEDIQAFGRAREKRNMLMHKGMQITVFGKREDLQDNMYPIFAYNEDSELDSLVARYVMWALYQEHHAYPATIPPPQGAG